MDEECLKEDCIKFLKKIFDFANEEYLTKKCEIEESFKNTFGAINEQLNRK